MKSPLSIFSVFVSLAILFAPRFLISLFILGVIGLVIFSYAKEEPLRRMALISAFFSIVISLVSIFGVADYFIENYEKNQIEQAREILQSEKKKP